LILCVIILLRLVPYVLDKQFKIKNVLQAHEKHSKFQFKIENKTKQNIFSYPHIDIYKRFDK